MKLCKINVENFLSFSNAELNVGNPSLTLILGKNHDNPSFTSNGAGKCLSGTTLLTDINTGKTLSIKEWYELYKSEKKLTLWGYENYKLSSTKVLNIFYTGKKDIYQLLLNNNSTFDGSLDHPILTDTGIKKLGELSSTDYVAVPKHYKILNDTKVVSDEDVVILAMLLADGGLTRSNYNFTKQDSDIEIINLLSAALDTKGLLLNKTKRAGHYSIKNKYQNRKAGNSFRKFYVALGIDKHKSVVKFIPKLFYEMTDAQAKLFLCCYWACGGYVSKERKRGNVEVSVSSSSKQLISDLQNLLLRFNILTTVDYRLVRQKFHSWRIKPVGRESFINLCNILKEIPLTRKKQRILAALKIVETLPINDNFFGLPYTVYFDKLINEYKESNLGKTNILRYSNYQLKHHNIGRDKLLKYAEHVNSDELRLIANSDIEWVKIKSINLLEKNGDTFDIEVDNVTHLYALYNCITHNSAICHAIIYCLYNKMLKDTSPIKEGEDSCKVMLLLDPEDGSERVVFSRGYANKKPFAEAYTEETLKPLFPAKNIKEYDSLVVKWLGLNYQLFINSVYFGKNLSELFMLSDDSSKKELLETILNVVSFEKAYDTTKNRRKTQETEKVKFETEYSIWTSRLAEIQANEKKYKQEFSLVEANYNAIAIKSKEQISIIDSNIFNYKKVLTWRADELKNIDVEYKQKLKDLQEAKDQLLLKYYQEAKLLSQKFNKLKAEEIANICASTDDAKAANIVLINEYKSLKVSTESKKSLAQQNSLILRTKKLEEEKRLKSIETINTNVPCTTCYQIIPCEHLKAEVDKSKNIISDYTTKYNEEQLILNKYSKEVVEIEEHIVALQEKNEELSKQYNIQIAKLNTKYMTLLDEANKEIQEHIVAINNSYNLDYKDITDDCNNEKNSINIEIDKVKNQMFILEKEKISISNEFSDLEKQYLKLKENLAYEQERIPKYKKKIDYFAAEVKKIENELVILDFWSQAFSSSGIKSFILENSLPYLTERSNYYSSYLTGGLITIEFLPFSTFKTVDKIKEKISIKITNSFGGNTYASCSDGEKRRIDLCILLAFQDLLLAQSTRKWNLLIFDEVLDALDTSGSEAVIDLFRLIAQDKNIFVISHNDDVKRYFEDVIIVQKKNGISYLE